MHQNVEKNGPMTQILQKKIFKKVHVLIIQ